MSSPWAVLYEMQTVPTSHDSRANGRRHQGQRRSPSTAHLSWQWHNELLVLCCTQSCTNMGSTEGKKRSQNNDPYIWVCLLCIIECKVEEVFVSSDFGGNQIIIINQSVKQWVKPRLESKWDRGKDPGKPGLTKTDSRGVPSDQR
jgi:hypothetical protein